MKKIVLQQNDQPYLGEVSLPYSKSLSNRVLIIRELCEQPFKIEHLSNADDTENLLKNLAENNSTIDVGAAGTNMRFLISLLSIKPYKRILTGTERMLQRPIGELVDGLRSIGAEITYLKEEGFPPIEINGKKLKGGKISIDGSISSQYISSLLMIAPAMENGLEIEILNQPVSMPYIEMTLELMKYFGIESMVNKNNITISPQSYQAKDYTVEADWSSAAFWYGIVAASKPGTSLSILHLSLDSLQGDKRTTEYFEELGISSFETKVGMKIEKTKPSKQDLRFDLINEPDLFPVLAYTCACLRVIAKFEGLQTLNLKESKRIESVKTELIKSGAMIDSGNDYFNIIGYTDLPSEITFQTHADHRLAMAAAIFGQSASRVTIHDTEVVTKSYPGFWEYLKNIRIANIY